MGDTNGSLKNAGSSNDKLIRRSLTNIRKTSVPAPFRGLMIAGVVVAVAAPFLGWILQALALLINSYWSTPCIDYILVEVIPCVRLGGVLLFLWGALGWLFNRREKEDGQ